jgi:hypothetical protein
MPKMRVVQVPKAGADFEVVEREIPEPPAGHVRIRSWRAGFATAIPTPRRACFRA